MSTPKISIVICTRNRAELLDKAIAGVYYQELINKHYELIIVDNNSSDNTKKVIDKWCYKFSHFKYLFVKKIGLPYARNAGWKSAQSEVIIYLDDDAIPDDNWLKNILITYKTYWNIEKCIAVGGGVRQYLLDGLIFPDWLPEKLKDYLTRLDYGSKSRVLEKNEQLVGANFSVPKIVLEKIGGFNENLYNYYGDERWIEEKIKSMGGFLVYSGDSFVKHAISSDRLTKEWFLNRFVLEGKVTQRSRTILRNDSTLRVILRLLKNIIMYFYYLFNKLKENEGDAQNYFLIVCNLAFLKGSVFDLFSTIKRRFTIWC